jgi:type II secretory pathway pseudopilin PulG
MKSPLSGSTGLRGRVGFTIIELLVAVGVTTLLVALMLTIVTNILSGWNRSSGALSGGSQARLVLDQLSQDLQSTVMRRDGEQTDASGNKYYNVWLAATIRGAASSIPTPAMAGADWSGDTSKPVTESLRIPQYIAGTVLPLVDSENPANSYRFGLGGVWLRFFTVVPDTNAGSDTLSAPRAVAYQLVRRKIGDADSYYYAYQFFRSEARPGPVGAGTNSTFNAGYNLFMTTSPGYNTADGVDGNVGNIRQPAEAQLIANNVIDFGVRFYENGVLKFPTTANAAQGYAATTGTTATSADGVAIVNRGFPTSADVFVRILTDEGARLINSLELGNITPPSGMSVANYWWQLADANSTVFTRRIDIKSSSL